MSSELVLIFDVNIGDGNGGDEEADEVVDDILQDAVHHVKKRSCPDGATDGFLYGVTEVDNGDDWSVGPQCKRRNHLSNLSPRSSRRPPPMASNPRPG